MFASLLCFSFNSVEVNPVLRKYVEFVSETCDIDINLKNNAASCC